jgi:PAS domain S-box-containing protein
LASQAPDELRAATLDALSQGVTVADARRPEQPIVYCNDAFLRLTGHTRETAIGASPRFLDGPGTDAGTVAALRAALADEQTFFGQLLNYRRDGTPFWNAVSITPLHDEDGLTTHHVTTHTDVTPLRQEGLLAEQHGRLELLDSVARGIAHDFNNVLLAASGYAELLAARLTGPEHESLRHWAAQIVGACLNGQSLTQQLLGFSRNRTGGDRPFDVAAVAAQTVALVHGLLPAGVTLRSVLPDRPALVRGDPAQLAQVLLNLLVNARDAVAPSGETAPAGEIVVTVACSEASVELEVRDSGAGSDDPERRLDAFFTREDGGNGLGRLTTNALVRRLGGSVDVRAEPGAGTTVVVALRAALA